MRTRPNLNTSPKAVQHYVEALERRLEQELAHKDAQIATLTRDATIADDWRGPFVAYVNTLEERTPLARVAETIDFIPYEDSRTRFSVRWSPEDDALEIRTVARGRGTMLIEPQACNTVLIRKDAR